MRATTLPLLYHNYHFPDRLLATLVKLPRTVPPTFAPNTI